MIFTVQHKPNSARLSLTMGEHIKRIIDSLWRLYLNDCRMLYFLKSLSYQLTSVVVFVTLDCTKPQSPIVNAWLTGVNSKLRDIYEGNITYKPTSRWVYWRIFIQLSLPCPCIAISLFFKVGKLQTVLTLMTILSQCVHALHCTSCTPLWCQLCILQILLARCLYSNLKIYRVTSNSERTARVD